MATVTGRTLWDWGFPLHGDLCIRLWAHACQPIGGLSLLFKCHQDRATGFPDSLRLEKQTGKKKLKCLFDPALWFHVAPQFCYSTANPSPAPSHG